MLTAFSSEFARRSSAGGARDVVRYQALKAAQKAAIDLLATAACKLRDCIVAGLKLAQKTAFVNSYKSAVNALAAPSQRWLTVAEATKLKTLAAAL